MQPGNCPLGRRRLQKANDLRKESRLTQPPSHKDLAEPTLEPGRRVSGGHSTDIVRRLEEEILRGQLHPGERLDERGLADRFDVSRTPIREALHRMAASGLVEMRARQGAFLVELPVPDLLDAFALVAQLEGTAAGFAARRIQPDERNRLVALHEACAARAEAGDEEGFFEANTQFHSAIIDAGHSRVLGDRLWTLRLIVAPYRFHVTYRPGRMRSSIPEHAAILAAILEGHDREAARLMEEHVNLLSENLSDLLHMVSLKSQANGR
ncbi:MAG: transcriptional regulator [Rhodobacteraceae bacterium]|nr:transcriptional regulator [Paracoccaceae bacterium]